MIFRSHVAKVYKLFTSCALFHIIYFLTLMSIAYVDGDVASDLFQYAHVSVVLVPIAQILILFNEVKS